MIGMTCGNGDLGAGGSLGVSVTTPAVVGRGVLTTVGKGLLRSGSGAALATIEGQTTVCTSTGAGAPALSGTDAAAKTG